MLIRSFQNHKKSSFVVLLFVLVAGYLLTTQVLSGPDVAQVQTTPVRRGDVENSIGSLGTLEPKEYVDVGTQVSGQLKKLLVEIGDEVTEGQLLAEIDPTVYESRVRNTRSTLANLEAQLNLQRAELELAKTRAQRNQNLFKADAVSRDTMLASQTEVDVAEARIKSIMAQLDAAQASLDGDIANLGYTKIYAPMSGTVVDASAIQGQTINSSQSAPTIVRIANLNTMTARAQVSEADVVKIYPGMPVYFTTLGMPDRRWEAKVRKVLPTPEIVNNVVLYSVLVDVDNADGALMTSMTTQVFFVQERAEDTLVVPASALRMPPPDVREKLRGDNKGAAPGAGKRRGPPSFVMVKTAQGTEWRQVQVGVRSRTEVEVLAGLNEGEHVVTSTAGGPPAQRSGGLPGGRFR